MSFHKSASDISVDENGILRAKLGNSEGDEVDAEFDLNTILGNDNGNFQWGGEGFANSASDIEFDLEGDDDVPILRANLGNLDGESVPANINLAEYIGNNDGSFYYTG